MPTKRLNDCAEPNDDGKRNLDPDIGCETQQVHTKSCDDIHNKYHKSTPQKNLESDSFYKKQGFGEPRECDPMTTGQIVDDAKTGDLPPDKSVIYRYAKGFRAADEAMKKLFANIKVIDDQGQVFGVPIIWGSQEKAVQVMLGNNVRKDETAVVDRIMLPAMSIYTSSYDFDQSRYIYHMALDYKRNSQTRFTNDGGQSLGSPAGHPGITTKERWWGNESEGFGDTIFGFARGIPMNLGYTLTIWTRFWEDMNQILEQVTLKFSPVAYIRLQGVTNWETTVSIDSIANNADMEPGDRNIRVFKYQIGLTTETYIPQPIARRKAVLKTRVDVLDGIEEDDIKCVVSRIEQAVGELDV